MPAPEVPNNATTESSPLVRLKLDQILANADGSLSIPNVSVQGGIALVEGTPKLVLDEVFGRSLRFTGAGDAVELPFIPAANGEFSFEIWVKPGQTKERAIVVSLAGESGLWALRASDYAEFRWRKPDGLEEWQTLTSRDPLVAEAWTHVAVSVGNDKVTLFINGTFAGEQDWEGGLVLSGQQRIRLGNNEVFEEVVGALQYTFVQPSEIMAAAVALNTSGELFIVTATTYSSIYFSIPNRGRSGSLGIGSRDEEGSQSSPVSCLQITKKGNLVIGGERGILLSDSYSGDAPSFSPLNLEGVHDGDSQGSRNVLGLAHDGGSTWLVLTDEDIWSFDGKENSGSRNYMGRADAIAWVPLHSGFLIADGSSLSALLQYYRDLIRVPVADSASSVAESGIIKIASCATYFTTAQDQKGAWATAHKDGTVRLWGAKSPRPDGYSADFPGPLLDGNGAQIVLEHPGLQDLAFSTDGLLLVTASEHGEARLWETTTGKPLCDTDGIVIVIPHDAPVTAVVFSPDNKSLVVAGGNTTRVWNVSALQGHPPSYLGDLSNFRFYPRALAEDEVAAAIQEDLPEIQVGTIFPLDFSLHNDQQQQVLYLTGKAQQLHLEITNVGRRNVMLPTRTGSPETVGDDSVLDSTMEIRFRPGTLLPESEITLAPQNGDDANWALTRTPDPDGTDVVHLVRVSPTGKGASDGSVAAPATLLPGETLHLTLGGLLANASLGSHSTRVQLIYRLHYDDHAPLCGSRLHYLRMLNMSDSVVQENVNNLLVGIEKKASSEYVDTTVTTKVAAVQSSLDQQISALRTKITSLEGRAQSEAEFDKEQYHLMQREYFKHGGPLVAGIVGIPPPS